MFERIDYLCKKNNITITKLCLEITGSKGNLPTWKKGNINPASLMKIADYFSCSVDYLLGRTEKSSPSELTENEQRMLDIFSGLTPTQQGELIGRASIMSEQNEAETKKKDRVS